MNQLHVYDPELFHPSLTHSVLAVLDGATLKLSYPKSNIPRRATFEEEILDAVFVSHRCYDLTDAKVSPGVPRSLPQAFPTPGPASPRSRCCRCSCARPAWPESGRGTRNIPSVCCSPSRPRASAGAARSTTRSCRGMRGAGRDRTSRGTAGTGACTCSGARGVRRRSGTSTSCKPPVGHPAATVTPGQVRSSHHGLSSAPGLIPERNPSVGSNEHGGTWRNPKCSQEGSPRQHRVGGMALASGTGIMSPLMSS